MSVSIQLSTQGPLALAADVLVIAVSPGPAVKQEPVKSLDKTLPGLAKLISREEFKGEKEQQFEVPTGGTLPFSRVVLLGTGQRGQLSNADFRTLSAKAARIANGCKAKSLALAFSENVTAEKLRYVTEGLVLGAYRFSKYYTGERRPKTELGTVTIALGGRARIGKPHKIAV